jgi:hypothetical protein
MFIHELLLGEVSKDLEAGLITNPDEIKDLKRMLTRQMNPIEKAIAVRCGKDAFETFVQSLGVISYAAEEAMKKRVKYMEDRDEEENPS